MPISVKKTSSNTHTPSLTRSVATRFSKTLEWGPHVIVLSMAFNSAGGGPAGTEELAPILRQAKR
jgi:hypothetical protein